MKENQSKVDEEFAIERSEKFNENKKLFWRKLRKRKEE